MNAAKQPESRQFWTPLQRMHQINEYLGETGTSTNEYRKFAYWRKFIEVFFDSGDLNSEWKITVNQKNSSNCEETFSMPLITVSRFLYLWALQGATRFQLNFSRVQEKMVSDVSSYNIVSLHANLQWITDYDNGLSLTRHFGSVNIHFNRAAQLTNFDWTISSAQLFFGNSIASYIPVDVSPWLNDSNAYFPPSVRDFLAFCTLISGALWVKTISLQI